MQMETYNYDGEVENGWVLLQLKATDHMASRHGAIAVRLDWSDLLYWLNEPLPGILVYYDAHIPLENILDEAAILSFAKLRDAAVAKMRSVAW